MSSNDTALQGGRSKDSMQQCKPFTISSLLYAHGSGDGLTPQHAHVLRLAPGKSACDVGVACRGMHAQEHATQASGSQGFW